MRHLSVAPEPDGDPALSHSETGPTIRETAPTAAAPPLDDIQEGTPPVPSPELAERFRRTDELLEGLTPEEKLQAARTFYYDAEGNPRARSLNLRPT